MMRSLLLVALAGLGEPAYPIPPEPLRVLLQWADLAVVAEVREASARETASASTDDGFWNEFVALDVERVLKDDPSTGTLVVPHMRGMICPEPAR